MIVLAGGFGEALAFGPGWLMGSAPPGVAGVTVIAGHRDTHFRLLEDLAPGDSLRIETPTGDLRQYRIERTRIVDSRSWRIKVEARDRRLLLVTCYPFDAVNPGGPLRFVVEAIERP